MHGSPSPDLYSLLGDYSKVLLRVLDGPGLPVSPNHTGESTLDLVGLPGGLRESPDPAIFTSGLEAR